ncbi:MAG TPA: alpha/beta fold hydrolase [Thermoanaerobaculia bacterium]
MKRIALLLLLTSALFADDLPRRLTIGVAAAPADNGLAVQSVTPGFPFEQAGIREGDVITLIDGKPMTNPRDLIASLRAHKLGETMHVDVLRGTEKKSFDVAMREHPKLTSNAYDIVYDSVRDPESGARYRVIVTKPRGVAKAPALYLVQGLGCFSIDTAQDFYTTMLDTATKQGIVTLRVDKPGAGDSEGGPCPEVDFNTELRAYQAGLRYLAAQPYVDAKHITLFGHSMGGIMAPVIAEAGPLSKAIVYGTGYSSWFYYMLENGRRQARLAATPFDVMGEQEKQFEKLNSLLFIQKKTLEEALTEVPAMRDHFPDGHSYAGGKPVKYFQQIYDLNLAKEWKEAKLPVTAIWGTSDFVSSEADHEWLAAAVNSWLPGKGKLVRLEKTDHWFNHAKDFTQSLMSGGSGTMNDAIVTTVLQEVDR